jgi:hypothetical protein
MSAVLFCSIFDGSFAARWLVMQRSLVRHVPDAAVIAFCLDDAAREIVNRLELTGVEAMALTELEAHDRELAALKSTRRATEYRYTVKPCLYRYLLEREDATAVVHVDADMMFFSRPTSLLRELEAGSVALVPSANPPSLPHVDEVYGIYQSGLIGFRNDEAGRTAASRWRDECLDWCGAEPEPGRWANKRYLNDWPRTLDGVRVVEDVGLSTAPWNVAGYELGEQAGNVLVHGSPLVLFHYSGASFAGGPPALLRVMALTRALRYQRGPAPFTWGHYYHRPRRLEWQLIWAPYARELSAALGAVRATGDHGRDGLGSPWTQFREVVLRRRILWGAALALRRVLDRSRSRTAIGALDRVRKRWRIE